jgi:hypothetical protein
MNGVCSWPLAVDLNCGSPTPRREAYCSFHAGIARIQRKSVGARTDIVLNGNDVEAAAKLANLKDGQCADHRSANLQALVAPVSQADAAKLFNDPSGNVEATAAKVRNEGSPELVTAVERGGVSAPITIIDLDASMCRWPLGDPRSDDFRYCGAPSPADRPYCGAHSRLAHGAR